MYAFYFKFCSISVLQHLEDLKKRELAAKLHNRQLLQQFDEAQDTLRSMLTLAASMRNIRVHRHMKKHKVYKDRGALKEIKTTFLFIFTPCRWNMKGTWNMNDSLCGSSHSGRRGKLLRQRYKLNTAHPHGHFCLTLPYLLEVWTMKTLPGQQKWWSGDSPCRSDVNFTSLLQPRPFIQPHLHLSSLAELPSPSVEVSSQCPLTTTPAATACITDRAKWQDPAEPKCTRPGFSAVWSSLVLVDWKPVCPWGWVGEISHGGHLCWEEGAAGWDRWRIKLKDRKVHQSKLQQSFVTGAGRQTR